MTTPKSPEQLAKAIEGLVASFMDEGRRAAEQAVQRSLSSGPMSPQSKDRKGAHTRSYGKRRSAEELREICDKLFSQVCTQPGASMAAFAEELRLPARALQGPMSKLRVEGRVRRVGERGNARYFPAVSKPPVNP